MCNIHISRAKVTKIESGVRTTNSTKYIILYFSNIDPAWYTTLPQNNGYFYGSQTSPTQPSFNNSYSLYLADDNISTGDVANKQFMLATALSAQAQGLTFSFVWDDATNKIIAIQTE
jgi:hypothetical protein